MSFLRSLFGRPRRAYALTVFLVWFLALLIQPGDLGSDDTARRMQVARWLVSDAPQVAPQDRGVFGAPNADGEWQAWYGIGQSLLLVPADAIAGVITHDQRLREALAALLLFPLIAAGGAAYALFLLRALGFSPGEAVAGTLALFFGTTFLHYAQIGQENGLEFLLLAGAFAHWIVYARQGRTAHAVAGSGLAGFLLLIRLTNALGVMAAGFAALAVLARERPGGLTPASFARFALSAAPLLFAALIIDRVYQFTRFGSWTSTYVGETYKWRTENIPGLAEGYPWSTPVADGLGGALFSLDKSIFLYDPLLIVSVLLAVVLWKRLPFAVKALLVGATALLIVQLLFFSRWFSWFGGASWANRFTVVAVQLLALPAVALLVRHWRMLKLPLRTAAVALAALAVVIQLSSTVFWYNLEITQADRDEASAAHIVERPANIARLVTGGFPEELAGSRLTTPNYLVFHAARLGGPGWAPWIWAVLVAAALGVAAMLFAGAVRASRPPVRSSSPD